MNAFDVIIIGFGKGGKTLAAKFAKHGQKVAIVERSGKMYEGTCTNIGCTPVKALVHRAKIVPGVKGLTFLEKREFYRNAVSVKDSVTGALRNKGYHNPADNPHMTIYTGLGSFVSSGTVSVRTAAEELLLVAKQIIINTGAKTIIPSIDGIADNPFAYTSTSIVELTDLPCCLAIVSGDYIRLGFASMYASFGSQVTVLKSYPESIAREDRGIAASIKGTLEKEGVVFRINAKVQSISHTSEKAIVTFTDLQTSEAFKLEVDTVLLATGRRSNTQGFHLEATGVEVDARGAIIIDEYLRTTNPAIRAVGDVKDSLQFTYISLNDCRIIRDDLFGDAERKTGDRNPISYSAFIGPPLVHVGLNEEEARKQSLDIIVKKLPVMAIPKARTLGKTDGLLKAIIGEKTEPILGYALFASDSSEVIDTVALAMKAEQGYTFLRGFIFTYPSMSETLNDLFAQ